MPTAVIAAVILTACLPSSDSCEADVPASWVNPSQTELLACIEQAEQFRAQGLWADCSLFRLPSAEEIAAAKPSANL